MLPYPARPAQHNQNRPDHPTFLEPCQTGSVLIQTESTSLFLQTLTTYSSITTGSSTKTIQFSMSSPTFHSQPEPDDQIDTIPNLFVTSKTSKLSLRGILTGQTDQHGMRLPPQIQSRAIICFLLRTRISAFLFHVQISRLIVDAFGTIAFIPAAYD